MNEEKVYIIDQLKQEIISHQLKSGEILFFVNQVPKNLETIDEKLNWFLNNNSIKIENSQFKSSEISKEEAISSIRYGLSTKPNYTLIEKQFNKSQQNQIAYSFVALFNKPKYYQLNTRIYTSNLDLSDFWECGGAFAIDNDLLGLLWTNDLYDHY